MHRKYMKKWYIPNNLKNGGNHDIPAHYPDSRLLKYAGFVFFNKKVDLLII